MLKGAIDMIRCTAARAAMATALILSLSACGDDTKKGNTTTRLDAVEVESGSISDAMISLDNVGADATAIDDSTPVDPSKKAVPKVEAAAPTDEADSSSLATAPGDVVVTPSGPAPTAAASKQ